MNRRSRVREKEEEDVVIVRILESRVDEFFTRDLWRVFTFRFLYSYNRSRYVGTLAIPASLNFGRKLHDICTHAPILTHRGNNKFPCLIYLSAQTGARGNGRECEHEGGHPHGPGSLRGARPEEMAVRCLEQRRDPSQLHGKRRDTRVSTSNFVRGFVSALN